MALVVEIAFRAAAGRHYRRAGKFQLLLSGYHRPALVVIPVGAAVVVVPEIISALLKRTNVDLYTSMLFWFVKEFVKAVLGLGLILAIVVFFKWINSDD